MRLKPTRSQEQEIADLEDHIATVSRMLQLLSIAARNAASNPRLLREIAQEVQYQTAQLATLHARRDRLRRQLTAPRWRPGPIVKRRKRE